MALDGLTVQQVVPDLEKFMQTVRDKINTIQDMKVWLESDKSPSTGPCKVSAPHYLDDWNSVLKAVLVV